MFPDCRSMAFTIISRSIRSRATLRETTSVEVTGMDGRSTSHPRSSGPMLVPSHMMTARCTRFFSSRTLPGQLCLLMKAMPAGENRSDFFLFSLL